MATELSYLDDSEVYESVAQVARVSREAEGEAVVVTLNKTIFYPQGGGQPTDKGVISTDGGSLQVERASFVDGDVLHSGVLTSGEIKEGEFAKLVIDASRRNIHAQLHTGGHLVMTAVDRLLGLPATKGYHFPNGPYVEFMGVVPQERRESLVQEIQEELDRLVEEDSPVTARYDTVENLKASGVYIPAEIPAGKPTRVVVTSGYQSPCGGTHVKSLGELGGLKVKGVKVKSGKTRVSYYFG
ncbi:alanine--tRNA ligase-related protein [Nocardiopsis sp. LOL_012]|uniref:alanine--tRNA ligase-related protein n=1 Tax=Nocardiopsis sp. LOL_012 TaxID=3345409 RepID=UPI003A8900A5